MEQNYESLLRKFRNMIMHGGKSAKADRLLLVALYKIKKIEKKNPFYILQKAVYNTTPVLFYKPKRKGPRTYRLPAPITNSKAMFFGIKWILDAARGRSEYGFSNRLSAELLEAAKGVGNAIKRKEELYKVIVDNRPFLKF